MVLKGFCGVQVTVQAQYNACFAGVLRGFCRFVCTVSMINISKSVLSYEYFYRWCFRPCAPIRVDYIVTVHIVNMYFKGKIHMKIGTKSILFGVHQFLLHPLLVAWAWWILYREWPRLHEWAAIITHDLGYWGSPNMDGPEGERHPEIVADWWRKHFGAFGWKVSREVLGHSRFHAAKNGLPLSKLFRPDKLSTALYPHWFYLLLGGLSGEIDEYMAACDDKYNDIMAIHKSRLQWLIEVQAHMALMGIRGADYEPVDAQIRRDSVEHK